MLVKADDAWQLAFVIEQIDENLFTVFTRSTKPLERRYKSFRERQNALRKYFTNAAMS